VATVAYAEIAAGLLTYFRHFETVYGARFTPGRAAAEAWTKLLDAGSWSAEDLVRTDEAMRRASVEVAPAAFELRMHYRGWRRSLGSPGAS
jgi:hypothetical protein